MCEECIKKTESLTNEDLIHISTDKDIFRFEIETTGSIDPFDCVNKAL